MNISFEVLQVLNSPILRTFALDDVHHSFLSESLSVLRIISKELEVSVIEPSFLTAQVRSGDRNIGTRIEPLKETFADLWSNVEGSIVEHAGAILADCSQVVLSDVEYCSELVVSALALNGSETDFLNLSVVVDDGVSLASDSSDDMAGRRENGLN